MTLPKPSRFWFAVLLLAWFAEMLHAQTPAVNASVLRPLSQAELVGALRDEVSQRAAQGRFSGTVVLTKSEKTIFSAAYGSADRERNLPNRIDTRFRVASMTKMMTAVAVLQLVQNGRLKLEDPIGKHLPDYPNQNAASAITIHHLLTHTGGLGDIFGPSLDANRLQLRAPQDYVNLFGARDLLFPPGSRWLYSNYGFIVLGAVIEKVSGQTYADYMRDHVFRPAGMTSTDTNMAAGDVAVAYTMSAATGQLQPNRTWLPYSGLSAGGIVSTAADVVRFANALQSHRLLSAEYTTMLTTGKVNTQSGKYGYGCFERVKDGVRSFGHSGNAPGVNSDLSIFPDVGYVIVVLANMDMPAATSITAFVADRLSKE